MNRRTNVIGITVLILVFVTVGIGLRLASSDGSGKSPDGMDMGTMDSATTHNATDLRFAQMMVPHHESAIAMARLVPSRSQNAEVIALAAQIEAAQAPEIATMKSWLTQWNAPNATSSDHDMAHGATMMPAGDLSTLEGLSGAAFDREFLTMMIEHHEGAVNEAKTEQQSGQFTSAKTMAAQIITNQTAEITTMRTMLGKL